MSTVNEKATGRAKRVVFTLLALIGALTLIAAALFLYGGLFPAGADQPHWQVTTNLIEMMRDRSVARQSAEIVVPSFEDGRLATRGASEYAEMCAGCHGAPGAGETELQRGLYPRPPNLSDHRMDPRRTFWTVKHGLKMTGMPAWGTSHGDDEIWAMVGFVSKLPGMTAAQYQEMIGSRAARGEAQGAAIAMPASPASSRAGPNER